MSATRAHIGALEIQGWGSRACNSLQGTTRCMKMIRLLNDVSRHVGSKGAHARYFSEICA